jgi:hypothetical protein
MRIEIRPIVNCATAGGLERCGDVLPDRGDPADWTEGADGRIFNAADDAPVTAFEVFNLSGAPIPADAATRMLDDPWNGIVETTAARGQLGFTPISRPCTSQSTPGR